MCSGPGRISVLRLTAVANSLERIGHRQASLAQDTLMMTKPIKPIPDRPAPGITRAAPSISHQGGGDKWTTDEGRQGLKARKSVTFGTWNVRTLRQAGKMEELTHEMKRYEWTVLGLSEVRWKGYGEKATDDGHMFYYCGRDDKHQHGVGFLVHKNTTSSVMGFQPISSRICTIRLKATPFNIMIIQVYAPTSDYDDDQVEDFYNQLQEVIDGKPKKDLLVVMGDWNAKVGKDTFEDWNKVQGQYCNEVSNERGLRLLEFATGNSLALANTLGKHKNSRKWTYQAPNGRHHQIDYILVQQRFRSGVNISKTRAFPGADVGSDHNLVLMSFSLHLKKIKRPDFTRIKFNLEKLKDPEVADMFKATIGGKFAPLLIYDDDRDVEELTSSYESAIVETAMEVLGKSRPKKRPWITPEILDMCDERRELKKDRASEEGASKYRSINKKIRRGMNEAKQQWVEDKCKRIENSLKKNDSKTAYQTVKELTSTQQSKTSTIVDKNGKNLTEMQDILNRWTEYCSELYSHKTDGDPNILLVQANPQEDHVDDTILKSEVEEAVKMLKKGKSPGVDNIPAELVKAGGEHMIEVMTKICNMIWKDGNWPKSWTQSLIITLPKKGNLKLCNNYRTISLISHPSKVLLRIILNRLKPQAEKIIAEEQAGFREKRSTMEQIFNLRVLGEKYLDHQQELYHVFIDFKKAFDRVWHEALWATMTKYNISTNLVEVIKHLYQEAKSAVFYNGSIGEWFQTTVGVRQGCLLSPTLFNIFLERIMSDALDDHVGSVSVGGRIITNLRFADDIDGLAGTKQELESLVRCLDESSQAYGMEISAEKTKVMANSIATGPMNVIKVNGQTLEVVKKFKYLGAIVSDEGSKPEVIARIGQATAALAKLDTIWKDKNVQLSTKVRLLRSLVISILLYACESWTLTCQLEKRINAMEMRCYRRLLGISYREHVTNIEVRSRITQVIGPHADLLSIVRKRKLQWFGHVTRGSGLAKTILQGTVEGGRKRGRPRKDWIGNIKDWTGLDLADIKKLTEDRVEWRRLVQKSSSMPQRPPRLRDR